ncbi:YtxH domain-containing protein [Georgenia sp. TF02-10]|uniref:YtxH domain-containing protein n=1 Tax=Georgenia sp. TF02-10 TaxID=2917725 RepID=UPI001FA7272A|nr:YtxH domain-containing protein [Georgenia sp. TF02-10]UNX55064.1 YtxH domain-containing protein [Georgenia sp. TF02-10]
MGKMSFLVGAGVGYVLGARAGRAQYERIKSYGASIWSNPKVQENVQKVETKVTDTAKERGAAVTDKVGAVVKDKISRGRNDGSDVPAGNTGRGTSGPMEPTPPQPEI